MRIGIELHVFAEFFTIENQINPPGSSLMNGTSKIILRSDKLLPAERTSFLRIDPAFHTEITPFPLLGKERIIILDRSQFHQISHSHFHSGLLGCTHSN